MRIHILGICGTFMGGLAMLARQLGHEVTGSESQCCAQVNRASKLRIILKCISHLPDICVK